MRRLAITLTLAALLAGCLASTASAARLLGGMGDQNSTSFSDPDFKKLGIKRSRYIVAIDAILYDGGRQAIAGYMNQARAAKIDVVVAFNQQGASRCPNVNCAIPSLSLYTKAVKAWRATYPYVRNYNFWNETNSATQPTGPTKTSVLKKTAALYKAAVKICGRKCTVTGPDILDQGIGDKRKSIRVRNQKRMLKWVGMFLKYAGKKNYPDVWGLHNYGDTNYSRSLGTQFFMKSVAKKGQVWVTETGGIYAFKTQDGKVVFKPDAARQARATRYAYKLARSNRRITRLYYYQWRKNNAGDFFDAGIRSFEGPLRPAYNELKKLPKSFWR
jgi:hypothetical protein